jgi:hypothetical protein
MGKLAGTSKNFFGFFIKQNGQRSFFLIESLVSIRGNSFIKEFFRTCLENRKRRISYGDFYKALGLILPDKKSLFGLSLKIS